MFQVKTIIFIFISAIAAAPNLSKRSFNQNEHLLLSDCGIGPDGASKSRRMIYYDGDWVGNEWVRPMMSVDVPWDGSYPWRPEGVTAAFPNGDIFTVHINDPKHPDGRDTVGSATHTYDAHPFDCYPDHTAKKDLMTLDDGTQCASAFVCHHNVEPTETPKPKPPPRHFTYSAYKEKVQLDGSFTLDDMFKFAKTENDYYCDESPHDIPGGCSITFKCGPTDAVYMINGMKDIVSNNKDFLKTFQKKIDPVCEEKHSSCLNPFTCFDSCFKWGPAEKTVTEIAQRGKADLVSDGEEKAWQSHAEFVISCPKHIEDCQSCSALAKTVSAIGLGVLSIFDPFLGMVSTAAVTAVCASSC